MKRYIRSATRNKPSRISINKLRSGVAIRDRVYTTPFTPLTKDHDSSIHGSDFQIRKATVWSDQNKIPYKELHTLHCDYIIDTQAHLDTAALSDDEDITLATVHIREAIQQICKMIVDDFASYRDDDRIIAYEVNVAVYGYGNYNVVLHDEANLLSEGGRRRSKLSGDHLYLHWESHTGTYVSGKSYGISVDDALADNTNFRRKAIPALVKMLGLPIEHLH